MNAPIDLTALKGRQQMAWASGDYAVIGTTLQIVGESLAEACELHWDEEVLDVAAGNGNATLAAARRGCKVTSTDYVSTLLERGAERARAEGLNVAFKVADVEALPFEDASFDAVVSTFGVMFAPDQARSASEMARVCRPGGRIGLANWTPEPGRRDVQDARPPTAATRGREVTVALGCRGASAFALRGTGRFDRGDAAVVQLPLPLGRALHRYLSHLVRPGAQGLCRPACGQGGGARARSDRSAESHESGRRRLAGGAKRVPRNCHHASLIAPKRMPPRLQRRVRRCGWDLAAARVTL